MTKPKHCEHTFSGPCITCDHPSKAKHAPGPWEAITTETMFEIKDAEGFPVMRIRGGMIPVNANARLIAAAPELLVELKRLHHELEICEKTAHVCNPEKCWTARTIAKAEGGQL